MTRALALAWLLAALLAAVGVAAQTQDKSASSDASITQQVESALASDRVLRHMDIKVETREGLVTLTGFVRSMEDIAKAGALAERVAGVVAVRNDLRVANQPSQA